MLTIPAGAFEGACAELLALVAQDYQPDLLIGIRTRGVAVAEAMARASARELSTAAITCRRSGAWRRVKAAVRDRLPLLRAILARLPPALRDGLKVAELRLTSRRRPSDQSVRTYPVDAADVAAVAALVHARSEPTRLLVVDDAVDSGATLASVLEALQRACPDAPLRSAVLTVTLDAPLIKPDFALHWGVVCRFPWSFDAAR